MALTVDQSQPTGSAGVGFGEYGRVRSRVQGFIPSVTRIDAVGFYFNGNKGSKGLRVELQTIAAGIPSGTVLASGQLTNAQLAATGENVIPLVYSGLSTSTAYALVLMPWDTTTNSYYDDYRDMLHVIANAYTPSSYWRYDTGAYVTEAIDFKFATYYDPAAGATNATVTAASQTATLSLPVANVATTATASVAPSAQSLTLAPVAPTVTAQGQATVTPSVESATLTPLAPSVTTTRAVTVTPAAQTLTSTLPAPTISASGNSTVATSNQSLVAALPVPSVTTQLQATVSPSAQTLTLVSPAPTISSTKNVNNPQATQGLVLGLLTPLITANRSITIVVTAITAQLSALAASIHLAAPGSIEKNLIDQNYDLVVDAAGEYVVANESGHVPLVTPKVPLKTPRAPLVTPNAALVSRAQHLLVRSTGDTVVARSSGTDVFTRGGTQPLTAPKPPLVSR